MELAERRLAARSVEFRMGQRQELIGAKEVIDTLPASTALISFVRYHHETLWQRGRSAEPAYVAFIVTANTAPAFVRVGTAATIDELVRNWRLQVTRPTLRPVADEREYSAAGAALRRIVWDPLVPFIRSSRRVFIVPDGVLNLVSFAALPRDDGGYLIESDPVFHYLAAERDLSTANHQALEPGSFVAIGGPAFDDRSVFENIRKEQRSSVNSLTADCVGLENVRFDPLPATQQEVLEIADISRAANRPTTTHVGRAATEAVLRRTSNQIAILHLATHGFFSTGECTSPIPRTRGVGAITGGISSRGDALRLSGLAFAGANHRSIAADGDDGILTAEEVASLDLRRAQWVVLSACDTGIGEVTDGEGILGLRRAFRVAGARTLIMSLWSVDDDATLQWMKALYKNRLIRQLDSSMSAREAALTILRLRRTARQSTHPFYWGSFVVVGDWG
jgi:CHAT domain-containing protein